MSSQTSGKTISGSWRAARKFHYFGLGVKRWLLLGSVGVGVWAIGIAFVIKNLLNIHLPNFLPWFLEGVLIGLGGVVIIGVAIYGLFRSVGPLLFSTTNVNALAETIYARRSRGRGPKVITIGGGTGLSVLLRGLKEHTENITSVVTVADDGGSSGRLRREMGVLPPGDFRNCLVALSDDETLLTELFQYRFTQGDGLAGHSFGNLFIVAMTDITGSFEAALSESSRVLAVRGKIVPPTTTPLRLVAEMTDGTIIKGESSITAQGGDIKRVVIEPAEARIHPETLEAIEAADLIVMGPGSLYTSILPNLLVSGVTQAIRESSALKLYVCNVATQYGETAGYTILDHAEALYSHTFSGIADYVVANSNHLQLGPEYLGDMVIDDGRVLAHSKLVMDDLVDPDHPVRHDSQKLAQVIMDVYDGSYTTRTPAQTASGVV